MSRRTRLLSAVLLAGFAFACGDALGPSASPYFVTTDKDEYDGELMEFDGTLISYLLPHVVYIELEVRNRGEAFLPLLQCDWGAGPVLLSAVVPPAFEEGPDPSSCPELSTRLLPPGGFFRSTIRMHLTADIAEAGSAGAERVLRIATRRGSMRSPSFRIRFPLS